MSVSVALFPGLHTDIFTIFTNAIQTSDKLQHVGTGLSSLVTKSTTLVQFEK